MTWQKTSKRKPTIGASPLVGPPKGNGVAERAIRTRKGQLLWVQHFATVGKLRGALRHFAAGYNATWIKQRHGYKTSDQISAAPKAHATNAAPGFEMAISQAQPPVSSPCASTPADPVARYRAAGRTKRAEASGERYPRRGDYAAEKAKACKITAANELLYAQIDKLEGGHPFGLRRLTP